MKILQLSTFPPRRCGIAQYCEQLVTHLRRHPGIDNVGVMVLAEPGTGLEYVADPRVVLALPQGTLRPVLHTIARTAADFDAIHVQHEFSLFGPEYPNLIEALQQTGKPIITTFHTLADAPPAVMLQEVHAFCGASCLVAVPTQTALATLISVYGMDSNRALAIPLGIPAVHYDPSPAAYKPGIGADGRTVLTTAGLINRNKGIDRVVQALPWVVREFPDVVYIVVGETHPAVRARENEAYRNEVFRLVHTSGLDGHVAFMNVFVSDQSLVQYMQASDIYLAPYQIPSQISSYTLNYALGCGRPIISTPTAYSQEALEGGRGIVMDFGDARNLGATINSVLGNPARSAALSQAAWQFGRTLVWDRVIDRYIDLYRRALS